MRSTRSCLPARWAGLVAIGAVHRLVPSGLEGHEGFLPAPRAGRGVHLPLWTVVAAGGTSAVRTAGIAAAGPPLCPAAWTALRILVAAFRVVLLVVCAKGEFLAALGAGQSSIGRIHRFQLFCKSRSERAGRSHGCDQRTSEHRTVPTTSSLANRSSGPLCARTLNALCDPVSGGGVSQAA